ncbi:MAG: NAD(P)H-dependent oxidoreductase [Pseudomonadota bacterium]
MARRIFLMDGHPAPRSISGTLLATYGGAAEGAGHDLRRMALSEMTFDIDHGVGGYASQKPFEPDLEAFIANLEWCEHVVLAFPLWWGTVPAKLKGVFDRALFPGRAFSTRERTMIGVPKPMLTGRTARVFVTADTPAFYLRLAYGNAVRRQIARQVLGFCGIRPVAFDHFFPGTDASEEQIAAFADRARARGAAGA